MKSKTLLTLSASVAAGMSASAEVQHTELATPMSFDSTGSGINFHLSEEWAQQSNAGATLAGEFRLSFKDSASDKPQISTNNPESGILSFQGGTTTYAQKLAPDSLISGSGTYLNARSVYLGFQDTPSGPFQMGTRGYVGLRFQEDATPYYGWADIAYTLDRELVLYSFAYEDNGSPIRAGAVIPEPKTTALLTALLSGSALLYHRRRKTAHA